MKKIIAFITAMLIAVVMLSIGTSPGAASGTDPCVPTPDQTVTQWFETDPGTPWTATGNSRVKTAAVPDSYTDWANSGDQIRTEENIAPGTDTDLVRYLFVSATEAEVITPAVPAQHYSLKGNSGIEKDETPVFPAEYWQANTTQEPPGHYGNHKKPDGSTYVEGEEGLHYASHGSEGLRDWFYFEAGSPAVTDIDYLWQKQTRTFVPGSAAVLEYEYTKVIEGVECDDEPVVTEGELVNVVEVSSYECGDDFETVVTTTTTTPWTQVEGEEKVFGEPVVDTETTKVPVEVTPCDKPDEPKNPDNPNNPDEPRGTPKPDKAVPTSVDAGLASVDLDVGDNKDNSDVELLVIGFLVLVGGILIGRLTK